MHVQVDVYAFSMIAYELFEGSTPFGRLHPVEAARRAAMNHARPAWGRANRFSSCPSARRGLPRTTEEALFLAGGRRSSLLQSLVAVMTKRARRSCSGGAGMLLLHNLPPN
jgi:hypothetical protein